MAGRTGVARKVDRLGRVVLPAEVRRHFDISPGDLIEIAVDSEAILLTKVENRCVFCGETATLSEFSGKLVCGGCLAPLSAEPASSAQPPPRHGAAPSPRPPRPPAGARVPRRRA